jgi:hypothetical protein
VRRFACYEQAQAAGLPICSAPYAKADQAWQDICALTREVLAIGRLEVRHG